MKDKIFRDFKIIQKHCGTGKFCIEAKKIYKDILDKVLLDTQEFSKDGVFKDYIYDETPELLLKRIKDNIDKFYTKRKQIEELILMKYIQTKFIKKIKEVTRELIKNE